jgi:site-specific recombinase XerC
MLDESADLCTIQELLGYERLSVTHSCIQPTTKYTLEVYDKTHPLGALSALD